MQAWQETRGGVRQRVAARQEVLGAWDPSLKDCSLFWGAPNETKNHLAIIRSCHAWHAKMKTTCFVCFHGAFFCLWRCLGTFWKIWQDEKVAMFHLQMRTTVVFVFIVLAICFSRCLWRFCFAIGVQSMTTFCYASSPKTSPPRNPHKLLNGLLLESLGSCQVILGQRASPCLVRR